MTKFVKKVSESQEKNIETVLKKGKIALINTNYKIPRVFIPANRYFSSRMFRHLRIPNSRRNFKNLCIRLYKQVYPQKPVSEKSIETQFKRLFNNKNKSYLGYRIVACETQNDLNSLKIPEKGFSLLNNSLETNQELNTKLSVSYLFNQITTFYKTFLPDLLSNWLEFLNKYHLEANNLGTIQQVSDSVKMDELDAFDNFTTGSDMIRYLETSSSIYHKMCLFFNQNPITSTWANQNNIQCEEHHQFPLYLTKLYETPTRSLNVSFNIIYVPCFIHIFLHGLRFLEFNFQQDLQAVKILYFSLHKKETENLSQNKSNGSLESLSDEKFLVRLFSDLDRWIKDPTISKQLYTNQSVMQELIKQQSSITRSVYESETTWKNTMYKDLPSLTIPANQVQLHPEMAQRLIEQLEVYFKKNPNCEKPMGWENRSSKQLGKRVSKYLNQKQSNGIAFWGFYLSTNEKELIASRQTSFVQKSQKNSSLKMKSFLESNGYQWINVKYSKQLMFKANQYATFSDMVYDLIQLLPLDKRPKNWENPKKSASRVNDRVVSKFRDTINACIAPDQKGTRNMYAGWFLKKL